MLPSSPRSYSKVQPPCSKSSAPPGSSNTPSTETNSVTTSLPIFALLPVGSQQRPASSGELIGVRAISLHTGLGCACAPLRSRAAGGVARARAAVLQEDPRRIVRVPSLARRGDRRSRARRARGSLDGRGALTDRGDRPARPRRAADPPLARGPPAHEADPVEPGHMGTAGRDRPLPARPGGTLDRPGRARAEERAAARPLRAPARPSARARAVSRESGPVHRRGLHDRHDDSDPRTAASSRR